MREPGQSFNDVVGSCWDRSESTVQNISNMESTLHERGQDVFGNLTRRKN